MILDRYVFEQNMDHLISDHELREQMTVQYEGLMLENKKIEFRNVAASNLLSCIYIHLVNKTDKNSKLMVKMISRKLLWELSHDLALVSNQGKLICIGFFDSEGTIQKILSHDQYTLCQNHQIKIRFDE